MIRRLDAPPAHGRGDSTHRPVFRPAEFAGLGCGVTSLVFCRPLPGALSCSPHELARIPEKDRGLAPAIFSPAELNFGLSLSSTERDHLFSAFGFLDAVSIPIRIVDRSGAAAVGMCFCSDANSVSATIARRKGDRKGRAMVPRFQKSVSVAAGKAVRVSGSRPGGFAELAFFGASST